MKTCKILISHGYNVEKRTDTVSISDAERILSGKKQRKFTYATRHEFQASLVRHVWSCPFCIAHIPAYPYFFGQDSISEKKSQSEISDWATLQMSLFEEPDKALFFNLPLKNGKIKCPECGKTSERNSKARELLFQKNKNSLEITTEIDGLDEIFTLHWMSDKWLNLFFPIYKTVVFNFANGHTFLKLHNGSGTDYTVSDITKKPQSWNNGPICEMIKNNKVAARTLKRFFCERFDGSLPFRNVELTPEKYVLMCQFVGFPRQFYDAIPFSKNAYYIDPSFEKNIKRLHERKNAPQLFMESALPKVKSIKRIFFEEPGLFFYLRECEDLWSVIGDVNLFRELLQSSVVYEILSQYHLYPGVIGFYKDYVKVKSPRSLLKLLIDHSYDENDEARIYVTLNHSAQKQEHLNWKRGRIVRRHFDDEDDEEEIEDLYQTSYNFSTPLAQVDWQIAPCIIDGFAFLWLTNSADYYETGRTLHNCLRSWDRRYNPVVVVKENNKAIAAIEISITDRVVVQAKAAHNEPIKDGSRLTTAFEKWKKKYFIKDRRIEASMNFDGDIVHLLEQLPF